MIMNMFDKKSKKHNLIALFIWIVLSIYIFQLGGGLIEPIILYSTIGLFGTVFYIFWVFIVRFIIYNLLDKAHDYYSIKRFIPLFITLMIVLNGCVVWNKPDHVYEYCTTTFISGGLIGNIITNFFIYLLGFSGIVVITIMIIIVYILYIKNMNHTHVSEKPDVLKDNFKENVAKTDTTNSNNMFENIVNQITSPKPSPKKVKVKNTENEKYETMKNKINEVFSNFNLNAKVDSYIIGNSVIRFNVEVGSGVKVKKISELSDDISLAIGADGSTRIFIIPGMSKMGIEIPNPHKKVVLFTDIVNDKLFKENKDDGLIGVIGKDVLGNDILCDITKTPHMLIAGATGGGKSVALNGLICSLMLKYTPKEVKFWMIDPKMVELSSYKGTPYLIENIATNAKVAIDLLKKAVVEVTDRYQKFADLGVRNITGYNEKSDIKMPKIVIVIDELADLMMISPKDVEGLICRIAQLARACGVHMVVATQRPSVDVISGLIKANLPTRISFAVASQFDSRTILDMIGAEKLLGKGDMLYYPVGASVPTRIQGAYISDKDVEKIVNDVKKQYNKNDISLDDVVRFVKTKETISNNELKVKFGVGYNKANLLLSELHEKGIVGKKNGNNPRKVLNGEGDVD